MRLETNKKDVEGFFTSSVPLSGTLPHPLLPGAPWGWLWGPHFFFGEVLKISPPWWGVFLGPIPLPGADPPSATNQKTSGKTLRFFLRTGGGSFHPGRQIRPWWSTPRFHLYPGQPQKGVNSSREPSGGHSGVSFEV